ncbi:TraM recognition domain-containing protein [Pseudalkalibacillus sp. R45]|uniref:TraM recognition domain-containing protein n=1 Tax=Pseudalkalibacillus sp. R45 TaxID=3457433 RepID=UPI003FCC5A46
MAKSNEELSKELVLGIGMLIAALLIFPLFIFSIPFFMATRLLKKPKTHLALSILGCALFIGMLVYEPRSYFTLYHVLPVDFSWLTELVGETVEPNGFSLLMYGSGGMAVAYVWSVLMDYFRSKRVRSKEDERESVKRSPRFQKTYQQRFQLAEKVQKKWRADFLKGKTDQLLLGITETGKPYSMDFKEINQHMFVPATTGGGKTVLLLNYIEFALLKDYPLIFIDGKGSSESIDDVKALCERHGKTLDIFSDDGQLTYNPLRYGNATVIKDKLEQLIATESHYYTEISTSLVQAIIQFIDDYGFKRDLWTFAKFLNPNEIKDVLHSDVEEVDIDEVDGSYEENAYSSFLDEQEETEEAETTTSVKEKKTEMVRSSRAQRYFERFFERYEHEAEGELYLFSNASSVRTQLYLLLDSELGHLFEEKENGLDLIEVSDKRKALFVSFDGLIYDTFIKVIARFLILDLNYLVSYRNRKKKGDQPMLAIYDEFSVYANDKIVDTVNKSRSGGFHCIIATQTIADLEKIDPVLARQIIGNTNTFAIGQTNHSEEVEAWANILGTFKDIDLTIQTKEQSGRLRRVDLKSEMGTMRNVQKFKISPDEIRDLRTGQFILARKAAGQIIKPEVIYIRHPLKA